MAVLILKIEYDGTNYVGWQRQKNGISIQECIEEALYKLYREKLVLISAGRTDAGVHSLGQVAHSVIKNPSIKENGLLGINEIFIPYEKLPLAINKYLKNDIRILNAIITEKQFHSRYDARERIYSYYITKFKSVFYNRYSAYIGYELDWNLLVASAELFKGEKDFTTFSKYNDSTHSYVCNVKECKWIQLDKYNWKFVIRANRFVYGMVRAIVGACIDVARGKRTLDEVREALEKKDRKFISTLVPACGLFLDKILYDVDIDFLDKVQSL